MSTPYANTLRLPHPRRDLKSCPFMALRLDFNSGFFSNPVRAHLPPPLPLAHLMKLALRGPHATVHMIFPFEPLPLDSNASVSMGGAVAPLAVLCLSGSCSSSSILSMMRLHCFCCVLHHTDLIALARTPLPSVIVVGGILWMSSTSPVESANLNDQVEP